MFEGRIYSSPPDRCARMTQAVRRHLPSRRRVRILDLGCGTGNQAMDLARSIPGARVTGVDVSKANIREARKSAEGTGLEGRVDFIEGDYIETSLAPFDVILSDSTLHNLGPSAERVFGKIHGDLRTPGTLIVTLPTDGIYNRVLWSLRRLARSISGPRTDAWVLRTARVLHGGGMPESYLRERVPYMYLLPAFSYSASLVGMLEQAFGWVLIEESPEPQASPAQPKHVLAVFRREGRSLQSDQGAPSAQ